MASLMDTLCPSCFRETVVNGTCTVCGYSKAEHTASEGHLPPFTILKTRYLLGRDLGQGGFGITYLAKDMVSGKLCCIKEYYPIGLIRGRDAEGRVLLNSEDCRAEFEQGRQRFLDETRALQELQGNITVVNIWDFFEENATAYFVMEYLDGCNLRTFQREHKPEENYKMSLQMLLLVGSALAEVHRFGIIHGDISPENIIVTQHGEIKLIDFGAARAFRGSGAQQTGKIYLKPNYAPYEQYSLRPCQGPWTDIYALAATFYYIVSNQKMVDAPSRAKGAKYTPLSQLCSQVSPGLSAVIDHALAFDYHDRYSSMKEFFADLEQVVSPEDYNIDLAEMMPKTQETIFLEEQEEKRKEQERRRQEELRKQDSEKVQSVSVESMPEPHTFWPFGRKKQKMAYLELTIQREWGRSKRRWLIQPNRAIKIGRHPTCEVMMPADNNISRIHCELVYNEKRGEFAVKDKSKFGTLLEDGTPMVKEKVYTLKEGGVFYVLSPEYMFRLVIES